MITVKGRFVGTAEILASLRALPPAVQGKPLLAAVRKEASDLAIVVAGAAPMDPGKPDLADSIGAVTLESTQHTARVAVMPRRGALWPHWFLWLFHEFGTSKMTGRPFIRPVWDARADGTIDRILKTLWRSIQARMRALRRAA